MVPVRVIVVVGPPGVVVGAGVVVREAGVVRVVANNFIDIAPGDFDLLLHCVL